MTPKDAIREPIPVALGEIIREGLPSKGIAPLYSNKKYILRLAYGENVPLHAQQLFDRKERLEIEAWERYEAETLRLDRYNSRGIIRQDFERVKVSPEKMAKALCETGKADIRAFFERLGSSQKFRAATMARIKRLNACVHAVTSDFDLWNPGKIEICLGCYRMRWASDSNVNMLLRLWHYYENRSAFYEGYSVLDSLA